MEAAPSEAPAPAPEVKGEPPGPLLNALSVEATARLLADYFHVDEDVVRRGFRNVDGATLSFYTDDELSQAGVANAPLRRRMLLELKKFGAEGVPPAAIVTMRDAVTSPTMPRSHFDNVDRRQVVPAEAVQVYPAITTTRSAPLPGRFSAPSRSQSGRGVDEEQRRERQRRILRHNSGAQSMSALDTSDDDRPASSESRGFLRRRSRDLTNFFRGLGRASRGSKDDLAETRRDTRLQGELRRYANTALPSNITAIHPDDRNDSDDECVQWVADVVFGKQRAPGQVIIRLPPNYPFAGPVLSFRDREVRFVLGQGGVRDDWDIVCVWTPAMSVADAVTEALAAVNQAEFTDAANMFAEEEALSRVTSSVRSEPDDDRRRAPSYDDFSSSGAAEAKA
jgi:ubiquitin-protein ligase